MTCDAKVPPCDQAGVIYLYAGKETAVLPAAYLKKYGTSQRFPGSHPAHIPTTMKTNPFFAAVVLSTAFLATGAVAQTSDQTTPPAATATTVSSMPAPTAIIYIPQLPNPAELANAAAAQGLAIDRIVQTSAQIIVVYKYANGQTNTVAYQLLPVAGAAPAAPAAPDATANVVPAATANVVYASPAPAYYYDPYYSMWPWPWFAPVAFSVGIGYGYHGGYGFRQGGYGFRQGGYGFRQGGYGFRHGGHGFRHH
jgi:hypothetical protein